ncbi:hypothetical protein FN846DRAFT_894598 [Sphaerosporella brunnea]|uniref:Uncharacterized protein n=1 Tax=Sphaerosporella brunnea TaxID=1250544 RepID=A0A5J5EJ24_9PEZI|nr:hypothetical protein FN846DRAFT_894598 [Sphaerosporella brunnea]
MIDIPADWRPPAPIRHPDFENLARNLSDKGTRGPAWPTLWGPICPTGRPLSKTWHLPSVEVDVARGWREGHTPGRAAWACGSTRGVESGLGMFTVGIPKGVPESFHSSFRDPETEVFLAIPSENTIPPGVPPPVPPPVPPNIELPCSSL